MQPPHLRLEPGEFYESNRITIKSLLAQQLGLAVSLEILKIRFKAGNTRDIADALSNAHTQSRELGQAFRRAIEPIYYNEIPRAPFCFLDPSFKTDYDSSQYRSFPNELHILIIRQLNVKDILSLWRTKNRKLRILIEDTPEILRRLHLRESRFLQTGFQDVALPEFRLSLGDELISLPRLNRRIQLYRQTNDPPSYFRFVDIHVSPFGYRPRLGKDIKQMLVCNPPIFLLEIYTTCCQPYDPLVPFPNFPRPPGPRLGTLKRSLNHSKGITVGDVFKEAKNIRRLHTCYPRMKSNTNEITLRFQGYAPQSAVDPDAVGRQVIYGECERHPTYGKTIHGHMHLLRAFEAFYAMHTIVHLRKPTVQQFLNVWNKDDGLRARQRVTPDYMRMRP